MESCSFWARKKIVEMWKSIYCKMDGFCHLTKDFISRCMVSSIPESWEVFVDFSFEWFSVSETMFASIQNLVHFKVYKVLNQHATNLRFKHVLSQKLFSSWCTIASCLFTIQQLPKQKFCRCDCNCIPYFSIFSPMEKF